LGVPDEYEEFSVAFLYKYPTSEKTMTTPMTISRMGNPSPEPLPQVMPQWGQTSPSLEEFETSLLQFVQVVT